MIGYVPQEIYLTDESITNNILLEKKIQISIKKNNNSFKIVKSL